MYTPAVFGSIKLKLQYLLLFHFNPSILASTSTDHNFYCFRNFCH